MSHPLRIQRKRTKGWRMPEGAVYVGRPTKWGNPFVHQDVSYAVRAFRLYVMGAIDWKTDFGFTGPRWANFKGSLPMPVKLGVTYADGENNGQRKPFLFRQFDDFPDELTMVQCPDLSFVRRHLDDLRGKQLACWCRLDCACHADVLCELANRE